MKDTTKETDHAALKDRSQGGVAREGRKSNYFRKHRSLCRVRELGTAGNVPVARADSLLDDLPRP